MTIQITTTLKTECPHAFEEFRQWLKNNYEFWVESPAIDPSKVIGFCERQFEAQAGYFLRYLYEKGAKIQQFHPLITPPEGEDPANPLWIISNFVTFSFRQIEYHLNTYFDEENNNSVTSGDVAIPPKSNSL